ncbi:MAG: TIGR01212 family radical SAM protein [Firmicutes bacterium]|nr:TIGR01212 family radical SAM protein [Bacillota bacterium]
MRWLDKRYHSLNYELRKEFNQKVIKLSLSGGFTCPNRDGTIGNKGCLFCSEKGSGEFAASKELSIKEQINEQKNFLSKKWQTGKYIAYFQSYSNTYSTVKDLKYKFNEAIDSKGVVGLAVATRPDCLNEDILDLLSDLNKRTYLWIELGLQTIHEKTAKLIRRGYDLTYFSDALKKLNDRNIKVVTHLIMGLPTETKNDMLESVKYISKLNLYGVKFHLMHILKDTDLYKYYNDNPFKLFTKEEYISLIADSIELLPPEIVIHRLTGDGAKEKLIAPRWSLNKLSVLTGIDKELKIRDTYQGFRYEKSF